MSLSAPAISAMAAESSTRAVLSEWLKKWFDGDVHSIHGQSAVFPRVDVAFGESEIAQPLNRPGDATSTSVEIRVMTIPRVKCLDINSNILYEGKLVTDKVLFQIWISAKKPGLGQSSYLAGRVGDLLAALLTNPETRYELNQRGIMTIRPQPLEDIPSKDGFRMRLLAVSADLQYGVTFGDDGFVDPAPDEDSQMFYREVVLVPGEYLLGAYLWSVRRQLTSVRVDGVVPQTGTPTVLELEIDGVLTGQQVTLPADGLDENVVVTQSLTDVLVLPQKPIKWKIISGPETGEDAAWKVTLTVQSRVA